MKVLHCKLPDQYIKNDLCDLDMVESLFTRFYSKGYVMEPEQVAIYRNLASKLSGQRIVDIGCGSGVGTFMMASNRCSVTGLDISPKCIQFARSIYPSMTFKGHDILSGPVRYVADALIAVEVIEHIDKPELFLENMLASDIPIFVTSPNRNNHTIGQFRPKNINHVQELTTQKFTNMLPNNSVIKRDPFSFQPLPIDTTVTPVVYEIT